MVDSNAKKHHFFHFDLRGHWRLITIAGIALALTLFGGVVELATSGSSPTPPSTSFDRVSTSGTAVSALPLDERALQRFREHGGTELGQISLLGVIGERSYYRIAGRDGSNCYAVGPSGPASYRLGQILCAPDFPSRSRPVLDFTVFHGDRNTRTVWRSEGIAADGIKSVGFMNAAGDLSVETRVRNNAFLLPADSIKKPSRLVARDSSGEVISAVPLIQP